MVVGELTQERDVVIIGGGPGGYHAAIRAAQLGRQVTLIEKNELGGICLNEGCIPSKIHTAAAQQFNQLTSYDTFGLNTSDVTFNLALLQENKRKTVHNLKQGINALCKANKVEIVTGEASFISEKKIGVENGHQYDTYTFNHAIIATGAPRKLILDVQDKALTPITIWKLDDIPQELVLYGSNDITLEIATTFNRLGAYVTLIIPPDKELFSFDPSINKELQRQLKKQKIKIVKVTEAPKAYYDQNQWEVVFSDKTLSATHFYVEDERVPITNTVGIDRSGVVVDEEGFIITNKQCMTNISNIYAVGDITSGSGLAIKAIKQAKVAAENIAGGQTEYDITFLPTVIQTIPPIATVGLTETEAIEKGYKVKVGESFFQTNGYATILSQKDGLVKTITDIETEQLLGMHIIGSQAVELISTGVVTLEMVGRLEDLLFPTYPHPSVNEVMLEAVEDVTGVAIHKMPKPRKQKIPTN
ncbi:dihydrolipoyl dehydrogenase family protein [Sutcliffiella rhizosphaerae]|uniref:Dihydrolipoyl dehydrogenase n=1 Tax=Sutcliffiella rhizosphaerae TaxID=2880967 RepID=A0ABM8YP09_9BACI|nr:FAD-dependent oxidoreductase [Sutcliffiella rhizosphaerae]CAG9621708.1 Dihydrolipoyl dehydrogenase [Sutcliffiella rhizosphaerae]